MLGVMMEVELDAFVTSDTSAVLVECKTCFKLEHVEELDFKVKRLR